MEVRAVSPPASKTLAPLIKFARVKWRSYGCPRSSLNHSLRYWKNRKISVKFTAMPSPPRTRSVSLEELEYYRTHFLEAIREDGVVCLECGTMHRAVGSHLRLRHGMDVDSYKQAWGYNRKTALMIPVLVQAYREKALAMDLYSKSPPDAFLKAQEASRRYSRSYRREARLNNAAKVRERMAAGWRVVAQKKVEDGTLRALAAEGLTVEEIATRLGLRHVPYLRGRLIALGLLPPPQRPIPTAKLLTLRKAGLWPSEIAARTGMTVSAVSQRFEKLRRRGIEVPLPTGPLPNSRRRISDEQLLKLAQARLRIKEIAAKVGISYPGVQYRLKVLRRRGLLQHSPRSRSRRSQTEA